MIGVLPATLILWFYAWRYLRAAKQMRNGGQPFVYGFLDGLALSGKTATARGLTILGGSCAAFPFVAVVVGFVLARAF